MKGYIRQRSKGKWEITIDIGRDPATTNTGKSASWSGRGAAHQKAKEQWPFGSL